VVNVPRRLSVQFMAGITLTLVLMLGTNLIVVWRQQQRDVLAEMHGKATVVAKQLISTRLFVARVQDRINQDSSGHSEFKGLNPAAVGRGVGAIFQEISGFDVKQTRFVVRRPENAPDAFEWDALNRFSDDPELTEFWQQIQENGQPVYRYAVPLRMDKECLYCHGGPAGEKDIAGFAKEGYREGQIGGAISVRLPMSEAITRIRHNAVVQIWVIVGVTLVSLLVIYWLTRRLVTTPLGRLAAVAATIGEGRLEVPPGHLEVLKRSQELGVVAETFEGMARSLREVYENLEAKVADRTRELEQANKIQSQFLATVSHELRTPLTSIIAFTELLLKQATQPKQREYLEDVHESSRRLLDMVNNLLDLSRLEAGRVELFTDLVELPELIYEVARTLRPLADQKGIRLEVAEMPRLPLVLVDPLRIRQVLMNLVGNAVKFTPEGGLISLGARPVPGWVEVSVSDTGPGVAPEDRGLIFEAFRRVESPRGLHPGSGLGLALCRNLVELHGGEIWMEEAGGGGSIFRFTLPAVPMDEDKEAPGHAVQ